MYSGALDGPLRDAFDEVVRSWPNVRGRPVFGHPGYLAAGGMFAFLTNEGVALGKLSPDLTEELRAERGVRPFEHAGGERPWLILPLEGDEDLDRVLSWTRTSYERSEGIG